VKRVPAEYATRFPSALNTGALYANPGPRSIAVTPPVARFFTRRHEKERAQPKLGAVDVNATERPSALIAASADDPSAWPPSAAVLTRSAPGGRCGAASAGPVAAPSARSSAAPRDMVEVRPDINMASPETSSSPGPSPGTHRDASAPGSTGSIGRIAYNRDGRSRVREQPLVQELPYVAENLRPVSAPQSDRHMDGEAVEESAEPGGEPVRVDGPELTP
jgi:hypothetical protein